MAEQELDKKYYRIGDVAEITGVPISSIRYWEKEFSELKPRRSATNIRYYRPRDVETIKIINYLVNQKGLKLEAARQQMRTNKNNISRRFELLNILQDTRDDLENLLKALTKRR